MIQNVWFVIDSFGFDNGVFCIEDTDEYFNKTDWHWKYSAGHGKDSIRFHSTKEIADIYIKKLEAIAKLSELNITWKAVCFNIQDVDKSDSPISFERCDYDKFPRTEKTIPHNIVQKYKKELKRIEEQCKKELWDIARNNLHKRCV